MQFDRKRREVIALICGAAAAWLLAARAQPAAMPVIGFLSMESPSPFMHIVNAFRRGLSEAGYVEHRNVGIDYSWAEGRPDRLPALVAELAADPILKIKTAPVFEFGARDCKKRQPLQMGACKGLEIIRFPKTF